MRSELGRAVRKQFEAGFSRVASGFKPAAPPIPGFRLFERRHPSGFAEYVVLEFHPMYDSFDVELGWSTQGRYPPVPELGVAPLEMEEVRFRASHLWGGTRSGEDYWVLAPLPSLDRPESFLETPSLEAALKKVEPAVEEALRRIEEYVLPYLARAAAAHGGGGGRA